MFDRDGNGRVSLEEMAASLSIFHDGDPTEKMRLMFRVYDKVTARNVRNPRNVRGRHEPTEKMRLMSRVYDKVRKCARSFFKPARCGARVASVATAISARRCEIRYEYVLCVMQSNVM